MSDTPARLLSDMEQYTSTRPEWDEVSLEQEFGERARALDPHELLVHLFRTMQDSRLGVWLKLLSFAWRDLPYATWLRVLDDISDERAFVHQFLWFASETLGLDVHRIGLPDPNVEAELRSETFRHGGPLPMSRALRERMEDDFDYEAMWERLAREGAPIRHVPPGTEDRHTLLL